MKRKRSKKEQKTRLWHFLCDLKPGHLFTVRMHDTWRWLEPLCSFQRLQINRHFLPLYLGIAWTLKISSSNITVCKQAHQFNLSLIFPVLKVETKFISACPHLWNWLFSLHIDLHILKMCISGFFNNRKENNKFLLRCTGQLRAK